MVLAGLTKKYKVDNRKRDDNKRHTDCSATDKIMYVYHKQILI